MFTELYTGVIACDQHFRLPEISIIIFCSPRDGVVDPAGFCTALTRAATKAGAKVVEDCVVTGIDTDKNLFGSRQVSAVRTSKGTIKTNCVINCTGLLHSYKTIKQHVLTMDFV